MNELHGSRWQCIVLVSDHPIYQFLVCKHGQSTFTTDGDKLMAFDASGADISQEVQNDWDTWVNFKNSAIQEGQGSQSLEAFMKNKNSALFQKRGIQYWGSEDVEAESSADLSWIS